MPEEFADWLERSRRLRLLPPARASPTGSPPAPSDADALTLAELGERAKQFCTRLARTEPEPDAREADHDPSTNSNQQRATP